jgi:ATP-dependent phosphoenolpyruvate carboxykinase
MLQTKIILGDGIKLGRYSRDRKVPGRVSRKIASTIVASRYQSYGVETSDEFGMAVTLYLNGVSIGLQEPM